MMEFTSSQLKQLTTEELITLQSQIAKLLRSREERERRKAGRVIVELAAAHGIRLTDLGASPQPKRFYRNPLNQFETWAGRGPQPKWVQAHLNNGGTLSDIQVTEHQPTPPSGAQNDRLDRQRDQAG